MATSTFCECDTYRRRHLGGIRVCVSACPNYYAVSVEWLWIRLDILDVAVRRSCANQLLVRSSTHLAGVNHTETGPKSRVVAIPLATLPQIMTTGDVTTSLIRVSVAVKPGSVL